MYKVPALNTPTGTVLNEDNLDITYLMIYKIFPTEDILDITYLMTYKISLVKDNLDTTYLMIYKIRQS